jgi:cell division transport system permease protein
MFWIRYSFREAWRALWRQRGTAALSVLTIGAAILVLGGFLLARVTLDRAMAKWSAVAEFSIYLRDDITPDQRSAINRMLTDSPLVASRDYVSREEALTRFTRDFPDLASGLLATAQNPLPASLELRMNPRQSDAAAVDALAREMRSAAGVSDVRFDRRWLERLARMASAIQWVGWGLGAVLLLAAVLTVATVVRLSLHARRDEVEVMQLMGAPLGLLRGPLVVEGIIQGGLGAALALVALVAAFAAGQHQLAADLGAILDPSLVAFLPPSLSAALVAGGMVVGGLGGVLAARHVR